MLLSKNRNILLFTEQQHFCSYSVGVIPTIINAVFFKGEIVHFNILFYYR